MSKHKLKARNDFRESSPLQRTPKVANHRASYFLEQLGVESQFQATPAEFETTLRKVHIPRWHYLVIAEACVKRTT